MTDKQALELLKLLGLYFLTYPQEKADVLTCAELADDLATSIDDPTYTADAEAALDAVTA